MDGFEWNKIMMAVIMALLIGKISDKAGDILISPHIPDENPYVFAERPKENKASVEDILEPVEPLLAGADIEAGQKVARKCLQCHSFEKGGAQKIGPNLWDTVHNSFGHIEDYKYSKALMEQKEAGKKWTYEELNGFLKSPRKHLKGTKMAFIGLNKTQDRADIIAYMRTLSDAPAPLPEPSS